MLFIHLSASVESNEIMIWTLSKAFDTICHTILFSKLDLYGIRGNALEWITNYFTNRNQYMEYNGVKSNKGDINIGVPQLSILGPLLFILYINDLSNTSSQLSFVQFADDSNILISGTPLSAISKILNDEMMNICSWLKSNMLTLNVTKN